VVDGTATIEKDKLREYVDFLIYKGVEVISSKDVKSLA